MSLEVVWFVLIACLWTAYFVLEGFDFGVGMLLPVLGRSERARGVMFSSVGPVWDGNEVWLVIAGGAMFAAFPVWYATMFSGFYLALLVILVLLVVRVVSFEWRERCHGPRARTAWTWANTVASVGAPFLWAMALASLLHGVPLDGDHTYTGTILDLVSPYSVVCGVAVVALFAFHGAAYLGLRTAGELSVAAASVARRLGVVAAVLATAALAFTVVTAMDRNERDLVPVVVPAAVGAAALVGGVVAAARRREGWAFAMTALAVVAIVATIFTGLYPRVMVSSTSFADSLTIEAAASPHYSLSVITVVAGVFVPIVVIYQAWTYHVLRARLGGDTPAAPAG